MDKIIKNIYWVTLICAMTGNYAMATSKRLDAFPPHGVENPNASLMETVCGRRSRLTDRENKIIDMMRDAYNYLEKNLKPTDRRALEVSDYILEEIRHARFEGIGGKGKYASVRATDGIIYLIVHMLLTYDLDSQQKAELKRILIEMSSILDSLSHNSSACPHLDNIAKNLSLASKCLGVDLNPPSPVSHSGLPSAPDSRSSSASPSASSSRSPSPSSLAPTSRPGSLSASLPRSSSRSLSASLPRSSSTTSLRSPQTSTRSFPASSSASLSASLPRPSSTTSFRSPQTSTRSFPASSSASASASGSRSSSQSSSGSSKAPSKAPNLKSQQGSPLVSSFRHLSSFNPVSQQTSRPGSSKSGSPRAPRQGSSASQAQQKLRQGFPKQRPSQAPRLGFQQEHAKNQQARRRINAWGH